MTSMLFDAASRLLLAASLLAGLPVAAADPPENGEMANPEWAGDVVWRRQPGTIYYDQPLGVAMDNEGNVRFGQDLGGSARIAMYSSTGKLLRAFLVESWAYPHVAWDSAGNSLITGYNTSIYEAIAKYNFEGKRLWIHELNYPQTYPASISADNSGNILIAGSTTEDYACCPSEGFVAKYSPSGEVMWVRIFGSGYSSVAADADGNVVAAGRVETAPALVAKYSADGTLLWTRNFGAPKQAVEAFAVTTDSARNVVITGRISDFPYNLDLDNAFVAKYSPTGKLLWSRKLKTSVVEQARAVATDAARNVVISGLTGGLLCGPRHGGFDAFVAKYSSSGERRWCHQFGTLEDDLASGVVTDSAGNVVVTGQTRGPLGGRYHGDMDIFILKLRN